MGYKKGQSGNLKGKPKGIKNAVSADVKDMIMNALNMAGGAEYLLQQSKKNPTAFMALLGKILPKDVNVRTPDAPKDAPVPAFADFLARIAAAGNTGDDKGTLPH